MRTSNGIKRAKECIAHMLQLLAERGAEGILATEAEEALEAQCGGSQSANRGFLANSLRKGTIFGKRGTLKSNAWRMRYFSTQTQCDAYPVFEQRTPEQVAQDRRDYMKAYRREQRAAKPSARCERDPCGVKATKAAPRIPTGEPIETAQTKRTIIPTRPDPRYHVDPAHRGEWSAEWQAKRTPTPETPRKCTAKRTPKAVTC